MAAGLLPMPASLPMLHSNSQASFAHLAEQVLHIKTKRLLHRHLGELRRVGRRLQKHGTERAQAQGLTAACKPLDQVSRARGMRNRSQRNAMQQRQRACGRRHVQPSKGGLPACGAAPVQHRSLAGRGRAAWLPTGPTAHEKKMRRLILRRAASLPIAGVHQTHAEAWQCVGRKPAGVRQVKLQHGCRWHETQPNPKPPASRKQPKNEHLPARHTHLDESRASLLKRPPAWASGCTRHETQL